VLTAPGVAYLQPEGLEQAGLWSRLAPNLRLSVTSGALEQGDLEPAPRPLYVRVEGEPVSPGAAPVARFENGLALQSADVQVAPDGRAVDVQSVWTTDRPVPGNATAFFQVLDGDRLLVTDDTQLGSGLFPTRFWRPGDAVVERRRLALAERFDPARHTVVAGLYLPPDEARIGVVDSAGSVVADHIPLQRPP
jgi:hypothetical protein